MANDTWKYASNQFLVATEGSTALCGQILADHVPKLTAAAALFPAFAAASALTNDLRDQWRVHSIALDNAEAGLLSATLVLHEKLDSLTRKPDADTNSVLEAWETIIRGAVAYGGPTYTYLLPHGRETLTAGSILARCEALNAFGAALVEQVGKPTLVALAGTVSLFTNDVIALRHAQLARKAALGNARQAIEAMRVTVCKQMYATCGLAMQVWKETPERIETLWNTGLLRSTNQAIPAAPALPVWVPGARTLTVAALPVEATRLAAWRQGPGGAPEELGIGEAGALSVTIPAAITFDAGDRYQLWLTGLNSKGHSPPSPHVAWTAS